VSSNHHSLKGVRRAVGAHRRSCLRTLAILLLLSLSGCTDSGGPARYPVSGFVTLDDQPLKNGMIRLIPQETTMPLIGSKQTAVGPGAMAEILNGEFRFTKENGPVAGNHRVEIDSRPHLEFDIDDERSFATEMKKNGRSPLARNDVPAMYNSASTLTVLVAAESIKPLKFELRSKAR
jgi:hypothetical protein